MQLTFIGSGDAFSSGGRLHTCLHVATGGEAMLVDIGASAMVGLVKSGLDRAAIATILLTHFHGDHFGGLPFFLLDACFLQKRRAPLVIAGPVGVEARTRALMEMVYPGVLDRHAAFDLTFRETTPASPARLGALEVEAFPMVHDPAAGPCQGYRLGHDGKVLAFTGDTGWTDALVPLAAGADVFVTECCFVERDAPQHLNWRQLETHATRLTARRTILTHMGPEMLALENTGAATKAHDGLQVTV